MRRGPVGRWLGAATLAAALAAACGPTPPPSVGPTLSPAAAATASAQATAAPLVTPVPHPTGATDRVIMVQEAPPLVPHETAFVAMIPMASVYGDGTWVKVAHVSHYRIGGPALPALSPATRGTMSAESLDALLAAAQKAGMLAGGDREYMPPGDLTLDYPVTIATVAAGGSTSRTIAYGLATHFDSLGPKVNAERAGIANFLDRLDAAIAETASAPYVADSVRVRVWPFADGAFTPAQPPVAWPLPEQLQSLLAKWGPPSCGVLVGPDAAAILAAAAKATDRTPWTSGGESFTVILRPLLPGESGCAGW
jgi:hypothetical protein